MRKNIYFTNPERLERLVKSSGFNQSELIDKALELFENEYRQLPKIYGQIAEEIIRIETIRDHFPAQFTPEMNKDLTALNSAFDVLQTQIPIPETLKDSAGNEIAYEVTNPSPC